MSRAVKTLRRTAFGVLASGVACGIINSDVQLAFISD